MCISELTNLWGRTIGTPPPAQQFEIWAALHEPEVIRLGIIKTAQKAMQISMSEEHRIRFASKVMLTKDRRTADYAANHNAAKTDSNQKAGDRE